MKRLAQQSHLNSGKEYDRIFKQRQQKGVDEHDLRRWKKLLKHYKGGVLLDMGCLDSLIGPLAREKYPNGICYGIDYATQAVEEMQKKYPSLIYEVGYVDNTRFQMNFFDYVVAGELIEHLEDLHKFFEEAWRILKPGGVLALSTPLEEHREIGAVDKDRHLWSFNLEDIKKLWEDPGNPWVKSYGEVFDHTTIGSLFTWKPPFYRYCWKSLVCFCRKT